MIELCQKGLMHTDLQSLNKTAYLVVLIYRGAFYIYEENTLVWCRQIGNLSDPVPDPGNSYPGLGIGGSGKQPCTGPI